MEQVYLSLLAVGQCMAIRMKQHAIAQDIQSAIYTPDDVVIMPTGCLANRMPAQSTFAPLSTKETEYLSPVTQLVLHPFDPQFLPLQFLRRIVRMVTTRKTLMAHDCGVS